MVKPLLFREAGVTKLSLGTQRTIINFLMHGVIEKLVLIGFLYFTMKFNLCGKDSDTRSLNSIYSFSS